jgi:hypothetical protein
MNDLCQAFEATVEYQHISPNWSTGLRHQETQKHNHPFRFVPLQLGVFSMIENGKKNRRLSETPGYWF